MFALDTAAKAIRERRRDVTVFGNESPVMISDAEPGAKLGYRTWQYALAQIIHLALFHGDAFSRDNVAEESDFVFKEVTLGALRDE